MAKDNHSHPKILYTPDSVCRVKFSLYGGGASYTTNSLRDQKSFTTQSDPEQEKKISQEIKVC